MIKDQAKSYLLSLPESEFLNWYNNSVVDPFGDYPFATIQENTYENFWRIVTENKFSPEVILSLPNRYADCDKYFYIADEIRSFNSVRELLDGAEGDYIISVFLEEQL